MFGLGVGDVEEFSIVKHLGSTKFSYCVGNMIDHEYKFNRLVIGEGSVMEGSSTPFAISEHSYYVNLEGISVGQKRLAIDPKVFKKIGYETSRVIIDSGSVMTWLASIAYQTFAKEIENLAQGLLTKSRYIGQTDWELCYRRDVSRDLHGFPSMTFHLSQGADMVVDVLGMFIQLHPSLFCLAFGPCDFHDQDMKNKSIIGMLAQQEYNVAYDLGQNMLYFQRIDCELLDQ